MARLTATSVTRCPLAELDGQPGLCAQWSVRVGRPALAGRVLVEPDDVVIVIEETPMLLVPYDGQRVALAPRVEEVIVLSRRAHRALLGGPWYARVWRALRAQEPG